MKFQSFQYTLDMGHPPDDFNNLLKALWWDAKGNWDQAHKIIKDHPGKEAAWIHAYLHRKEGDLSNASYWYEKAGKTMPDTDIIEEFESITADILEKN